MRTIRIKIQAILLEIWNAGTGAPEQESWQQLGMAAGAFALPPACQGHTTLEQSVTHAL